MAQTQREQGGSRRSYRNLGLAVAIAVISLIGVGMASPFAALSVLFDGLGAALVVAPFALGGLMVLPLLRLHRLPLRWQLLTGAGLGIGGGSLLILLFGLAGFLQRSLWVGIVATILAAGVLRLRSLLAQAQDTEDTGDNARATALAKEPGHYPWYLWLILAPFLCTAVLAASHAPGLIWQEEGYGYDVLEYHLQMPKEYFHAGRIEYAPHNVYANFPANVEMLYLLGMILLDDDIDAGITANMIHLLFAMGTVWAAWVIGRDRSPQAGVIAAVTLASVNWLGYLSGLAYVENGMLFFGMTSFGLLLRGTAESETPRGLKPAAQGGVLAGLACGCKYTAFPMIAAPLGVAAFILASGGVRRRVLSFLVFGAAATAAVSPWLVKNVAMTGNPVFPLAHSVFGATPTGWDAECTDRWERGHRPAPDQRTLAARFDAWKRYVPGDRYQRFGPIIFVLAILGVIGRPCTRTDAALLAVLLIQLAVWFFATHLYARFAVVLLIPLTILCARSVVKPVGLRWWLIIATVVFGAAWDLGHAMRPYHGEPAAGAPASFLYEGQVPGYEHLAVVNGSLPQDAKILLLGDARAFYYQRPVDYYVVFNRNPFIETVRAASSASEVMAWVRDHGYTHILVHWGEIRRLRRSRYGFAEEIDERLFERMCDHGLARIQDFRHPRIPRPLVTLYEVRRSPAGLPQEAAPTQPPPTTEASVPRAPLRPPP